MKALFGRGRHPDAVAMQAAGATERETRLGADYLRFGRGPSVDRWPATTWCSRR